MARIIEADVIQKIATEAQWLTQTRIPYKGQIMIVSDNTGKVVNMKVGDGVNTFANLNYMFDFTNSQRISAVSPGTLPTPTEANTYMVVTRVGDYTFGGSTIASITQDGYQATLWWTGSTWVSNGTVRVKGDMPEGTDILEVEQIPKGKAVIKYSAPRDVVNSIFFGDKVDTSILGGYINKSTGEYTALSPWNSTDFISVNKNTIVDRKGSAFTAGQVSSVAPLAFYGKNYEYLGYLSYLTHDIAENISILVSDYYVDAEYIRASGTNSVPLEIKLTTKVQDKSIDKYPEVKAFAEAGVEDINLSETLLNGYYDNNGNFNSSSNWRATSPSEVTPGDVLMYQGITITAGRAIVGWDENMLNPVIIAGVVSNLEATSYIVPVSVRYAAACARYITGDVFSFHRKKNKVLQNTADINDLKGGYKYFSPKKIYGQVGKTLFLNPKGILAPRGIDMMWNLKEGNQEFLKLTPSTTSDINIELKFREGVKIKSAGITTVKVSPSSPVSPSTPQYFITLGDSTTLGEAYSYVRGAWPNECSRRLTGIGTALQSSPNNPVALSLSNINFIGTIGDQPIKCEGRGGWGYQNYLQNATVSGVSNAFWNPATSKFDLDYYLLQNGFSGVNSTGSNLTIIIQLGWNHVYNHSIDQVEVWCKELINLIHVAKPDAKVKLLGIATPPELNFKDFTGNRNVSAESIMIEAVIKYAELYDKIAASPTYSTFVEYIHIANQFFSDNSYPSTMENMSIRDVDNKIKVYTDYVHPNARGYAQIADAVFYNILYNYCR